MVALDREIEDTSAPEAPPSRRARSCSLKTPKHLQATEIPGVVDVLDKDLLRVSNVLGASNTLAVKLLLPGQPSMELEATGSDNVRKAVGEAVGFAVTSVLLGECEISQGSFLENAVEAPDALPSALGLLLQLHGL